MSESREQLKKGLIAGLRKGWRSYAWIFKIVVPVSFAVALLAWTGWLARADFLLRPVMGLIDLPPEAALPIVTGMALNLYAVIAIITVLPFSAEQMTLIAIFNLIAHGLILEGIVQHRSGLNVFKALLVRVGAAIVTTFIVSRLMGDTGQGLSISAGAVVQPPLLEALRHWAVDLAALLLKILAIIMVVMVVLQVSRAMGWIDHLIRAFRRVMSVLGLSSRVTMMWLTAIIFGLLYGGAVIVEETKKTTFPKADLERLHIFLGINHAMVEDPALFAVLGLNIFWLWVPRFVMAVAAVQAHRGVSSLVDRFASRKAKP